jgi:hypothetical protein
MTFRTFRGSILALVLAQVLTAAPASADMQLVMRDGHVWLRATDATVQEILAAWATLGHVRIVNGEQLTGGPVTLQLLDVTEEQALDVLLRSVAGYVAAARPTGDPNAAGFNRILILPASTASGGSATPASSALPQLSQSTAPQSTLPRQMVAPTPPTPFVPQWTNADGSQDSFGCAGVANFGDPQPPPPPGQTVQPQ